MRRTDFASDVLGRRDNSTKVSKLPSLILGNKKLLTRYQIRSFQSNIHWDYRTIRLTFIPGKPSNHLRSFQHRMQQHIAPRRDELRLGIFDFIVADAIFAGDEDHAAGGELGNVNGIGSGDLDGWYDSSHYNEKDSSDAIGTHDAG